jgi:spoIIIJ-associated protein
MLEQNQINKIKDAVKDFFEKMEMATSSIEVSLSSVKKDTQAERGLIGAPEEEPPDVVDLDIKLEEPQILIGQQGQTLFEIQRLLRTILNKKLQKSFFFNLDINDYKKKKIEYLKDFAKESADQVSLTKKEKALSPMPAYERRIIHAELSQRADIITESQGDGLDRHIVIKPK